MIAFWPNGISAEPGSISNQVGHVMDFMATFIDAAGAEYPSDFAGNKIKPIAGKSLIPVFQDQQREGHPTLFNEHEGGRSVRTEKWKLVTLGANEPWQLFQITEDQTETKNVAGDFPEVVQELDSLWQNWAKANKVIPKP